MTQTGDAVMPENPSYQALRARMAVLARYRDPDDPERIEASRDVYEARLERAIRRALADRPALTPDRRARLAVLLLDGVTADGTADPAGGAS